MRITSKVSRAAASFLIFGVATAAIPNSGIVSAGACGGSHNDAGAVVAGVAVVGGAAYYFIAADKKKKQDEETPPPAPANTTTDTTKPTSATDSGALHSYIYSGS